MSLIERVERKRDAGVPRYRCERKATRRSPPDQLAGDGDCVFCRECSALGRPQQFQRCRCRSGERTELDAIDHRPDAQRLLAGLSHNSADRRLDRGSDRAAAHARRRHGRLVALGAVDAAGADHLVAHSHFPRSARRVRGALHSGEHRRGVACDPVAVAAWQIRGLHAVGRAARTGNGCVLRRAYSASDRLAGLHLCRVRRHRPRPRSAPRRRRYRRGSS